MKKPTIPKDEAERLKELKRYEILDTDSEDSFDDITSLASEICETKISLISLIDEDRQWFKSKIGITANETSRDISWCGHAILDDDIFEIPDAAQDERFHDNPLYLEEPKVRFYAGAPLISKNGLKVGTLCVIDSNPKKLSDWQKQVLKKLAKQVVLLLEARIREKKLTEANSTLDAIVNNIPIMLSSFDENGNIDWVNKQWSLDLGWELESLKGKDILTEFYPDSQAKAQALSFMLDSQSKWKDFFTRKKNGEYIHTSWTNIKLPSGKTISIGQNIHERKSLETIATDVQRLAKVGGWELIIDTQEVKWTEETFNIYGIPKDKNIDLNEAINCYAPHERAKISSLVTRGIEEGKPWDDEFEFVDANGNHKWVRAIGEAVRNQEGKIYKVKGGFQDITERKKLQVSLDIERKISLHQAKLASIGQLASGVAHEINNPLAIIKGYIAVICDNHQLDEATLLRLEKINNSTNRIMNIVNGLRAFSRSDIEEIQIFQMEKVIEEAFKLLFEIYKQENIHLTLNLHDHKGLNILGNKGRMSQVVINLLANARDATEKQKERIISIDLDKINGAAVLKVTDNGKGIPLSIRDNIFDPFFTTKDVNQGTGIGLSIVNSIVKEHEGEVSFKSVINQGTTFTVRLPLSHDVPQSEVIVVKSIYGQVKTKLMVLVVDDEEEIRTILGILLARLGVNVTLAKDGKEALEKFNTQIFDLVLSDLKMPVIDGLTLVKMIRGKVDISIQPKIILMTGGVDKNILDEFTIQNNIDGYLYKPFTDEALYNKIKELFPN